MVRAVFRELEYVIAGVSSLIGREIGVEEWARRVPVPNRKVPGARLTGEDITRITGIESKSWDPELFGDLSTVTGVARAALDRAGVAPAEIDAVFVVTATPFRVQLDSDGFRMLRALGIPDHVPPIQLGAGCSGMARTMALAAQMGAERVLVITYEISSPYMESEIYRVNPTHPMADALWLSPALFSDAAAAVVLRREPGARGFVTYSRDSLEFGGEPGFEDPLIHYLGGGAEHPPGTPDGDRLAVFAMAGEATRRYYARGMELNHRALLARRPTFVEDVARIYVHQSSPRLVEGLFDYLAGEHGVPRAKLVSHVRRLGNLVTPSTVKLLDDDLAAGAVRAGDEICVSVVGAGPERGAYLIAIAA